MIWTEDMKETLMVLSMEGIPYNDVAKRMKEKYGLEFTKNSVIGMAWKIGAPRRPSIIKTDEPVTILDLQAGMCKWPLGEPEDRPPYIFCGEPTDDFCSWCAEHRQRAFQRVRF